MTRISQSIIMLLAGCSPSTEKERHTLEQELSPTAEEHLFAENISLLHTYLAAHASFYQQHDELAPTRDYGFYHTVRIRYADLKSWSKKLLDGTSQFLVGEDVK